MFGPKIFIDDAIVARNHRVRKEYRRVDSDNFSQHNDNYSYFSDDR